MALNDVLAKKKQREDELRNFIANRNQGIDSELAATRGRIEAGRAQTPGLDALSSGFNLSPGVQASAAQGVQNQASKLGANLNVNLAKTRYGLGQDRAQKLYQLAFDQAVNAGKSRQDAEAFARQYADQAIQQGYQAKANETGMNQQLREQQIKNDYYGQLQGLEDMYQPQNDAQGALTRVLTGLPVQLLTASAMNKGAAKPLPMNSQTPAPVATSQPYGPQNQNLGQYPYNPYSGGK